MNCKYWSLKDRKCKVTDNGVFIPLEYHVAAYCTSSEHTNCLQYKAEQSRLNSPEKNNKANRRKHQRVNKHQSITITQLSDSGRVLEKGSVLADTVNLSLGGMLLRTREPLLNDSVINFSLGQSKPSSKQSCLARVMWCRYSKDSLVYQAGLAFQDEKTVKTIDSRLLHSKH